MRALIFTLIFFAGLSSGIHAANLPPWFVSLREAVYGQQLTANQIEPMAREAAARANAELSGSDLFVMLSRIEFMMGRAYQNDERNRDAANRYSEGLRWAERALQEGPSAEAWEMMSVNIAQSSVVRSTLFAMTNGLRVERYARNALAINSRNATAQHMIAGRWVFAPAPFNNLERGLDMMKAILSESDMDDHERFNTYAAIGFAYVQMRRPQEARPWVARALEIYPTNKFALSLLDS
ncbi:MAG: hypothetical protein FWG66_05825 [Spirochaetes bacterium]|nr:hypothetical protein [Spirochaetota bacterium]